MRNVSVKTMKDYTFAAVLAGALALPIAANAAGNTDSTGTNAPAAKSAAPTPASPPAGSTANAQKDFTALDSDRSGSVSETEFDAGKLSGDFTTLDTDKDGQLTVAELKSGNAAYQRSAQ